jgi:hypothetical protein
MCGVYERISSMTPEEVSVVHLIVRESLTSNERRERLMHRFLTGHLPLFLRAMLEGIEQKELDPEIHPLIAMSCSMALGTIPLFMLKHSRARVETLLEVPNIPDFLRNTILSLAANCPGEANIAKQLSRIAARALGRRD